MVLCVVVITTIYGERASRRGRSLTEPQTPKTAAPKTAVKAKKRKTGPQPPPFARSMLTTAGPAAPGTVAMVFPMLICHPACCGVGASSM